ncbi:MAG: RNA polymerase sigma factor [Pseudomonadota bacterium]
MTEQSRPPTAPPSGALYDEWLVVLVKQGDRRAMERLYTRWHSRLARAALRYTGDAELARDLVQDCWVGIFKGIGKLRDPARFRSYAFAVLHRRGADYVRGAMRERASASAQDVETAPDHATPAIQDETIALQQAFTALPPDQRLAAHLHFVEGLTLREIADVQQIATGTAKSRLFHARRKLKAALADTTPEPTTGDTV